MNMFIVNSISDKLGRVSDGELEIYCDSDRHGAG